MKRTLLMLFVMILCLTPALSLAGLNLVMNGDFEEPQITGNYYLTVNAGGSGLTDWSVGDTSIDIVTTATGRPNWARTGVQAVDMAGTSGPGSIYQTIATTPGTTYKLTFFVSSNADQGSGFANSLQVYWAGALQGTFSSPAPGTWDTYTLYLTAAGASSELKFYTPISTNQGPLLDTVSLHVVPLPPAAWLLAGGLVGLAAIRRRRTM